MCGYRFSTYGKQAEQGSRKKLTLGLSASAHLQSDSVLGTLIFSRATELLQVQREEEDRARATDDCLGGSEIQGLSHNTGDLSAILDLTLKSDDPQYAFAGEFWTTLGMGLTDLRDPRSTSGEENRLRFEAAHSRLSDDIGA
eukprot:766555-Hanusia_phi.AAC.12